MTVTFAEEYVILGDVLGLPLRAGALLLEGVLLPRTLLACVLLLGVLLQAATTSPAARITAMAARRDQLRSMRTPPLLCPALDVNPG